MDYSKIKYHKNYINKVIFRIDFLEFISSEEVFHSEIISEIKKSYPSKGIDQVMRFNILNLRTAGSAIVPKVDGQTHEGLQQSFTTSNGDGKLILNNKSLIVETDTYQTFDSFISSFRNVIYALYRKKRISTERIGIRFINIFNSDTKVQKNYFSRNIASSLDITSIKGTKELASIRSLTLSEYRVENIILNFRYGRINLQYPKIIDSIDFTLDFDCFTNESMQSVSDILDFINKGHYYIQELFEASITDNLRSEMRYDG